MSDEVKWYVAHTYSGYENNVKVNIEKTIENRNMEDQILEVTVPMQEVTEEKNGKVKVSMKKLFPGYVLLKMILNDDTWFVVRNTRGVTSFVGPGSKPVPLSDAEVIRMGVEVTNYNLELEVGDYIEIISGLFEGSKSKIKNINIKKRTVLVDISVFGRETPTELDFVQVKKM